jgi:hypothetical protein
MRVLYHFTGLTALVGVDGIAAMKSHDGNCDASDFAAPGSILADGIRPTKTTDYDPMLRSPLPPCVWLTDNPEMPDGASSLSGFRISVGIPSADHRLFRWRTYFAQHAPGAFGLALPEAVRIEFDRFYVFFGKILPKHFKAVEVAPRR